MMAGACDGATRDQAPVLSTPHLDWGLPDGTNGIARDHLDDILAHLQADRDLAMRAADPAGEVGGDDADEGLGRHVKPHALRLTLSCFCATSGEPLAAAKVMMRHSSESCVPEQAYQTFRRSRSCWGSRASPWWWRRRRRRR